jgi:site-specific DNA-methyltransferase (adenine-specific)
MTEIMLGDNLPILRSLPDCSFALIYIDPPFNTGAVRRRSLTRAIRDDSPEARPRFGGRTYREVLRSDAASMAFDDAFDDYLAFLEPRLVEARRLLTPTGSFFLHVDPRESHYCKVLLDAIYGRASFMNEIIWAYDYGARPRSRWPAKHDVILWYAADPAQYTYNYDQIDRVPYMAPRLVGPEKAARGKTPTDVWWHTIVSPTGKEKSGYPTQKPLALIERIVRVHSNPGDRVLDFFAGSGTTGVAAARLGRECLLIDSNPDAVEVCRRRLDEATNRAETLAVTDSPTPSSQARP